MSVSTRRITALLFTLLLSLGMVACASEEGGDTGTTDTSSEAGGAASEGASEGASEASSEG
jgi:hypothetical protein